MKTVSVRRAFIQACCESQTIYVVSDSIDRKQNVDIIQVYINLFTFYRSICGWYINLIRFHVIVSFVCFLHPDALSNILSAW